MFEGKYGHQTIDVKSNLNCKCAFSMSFKVIQTPDFIDEGFLFVGVINIWFLWIKMIIMFYTLFYFLI